MSALPPKAPLPRPKLVAITWPIFAEQLLHMILGVLGVWLVSRLSDGAAAAFALANQINLAFMITFRFVSLGASVVVTQYLGAQDHAGAADVSRAAIGANAWMGVISCVLIALGAEQMLGAMHLPPELMSTAKPYLMLVGVMLLFDAINFSLGAVLRANTFTRDTLRLIIVMYALQMALGLPLMYGVGPLPGMGMEGLAVGAIASRAFSLWLHVRLWRSRLGIYPSVTDFWRVRWSRVREMLHIGLPGAGENVAYRSCYMMILAMVASMGPSALATHTYTIQIVQFLLLFGLSVGFGTEIVVGHRVGAGDLQSAHRQVKGGLIAGIVVSLLVTLCAALAGPHLLGFFTKDAAIIALGAQLIWFNLLVEPGRTFNMVVINGLRATGDARFPVGFGVFSMFFVGVGLSWFLGVHMGLGLVGVWLGYAADEWTRAIAMFARWQLRGWVPHARRTRRKVRLKAG